MKLSAVIFLASLSLTQATGWYPVNSKQEIPSEIVPYTKGQEVSFGCIQRNIDNGEHKFDEKKISYTDHSQHVKKQGNHWHSNME